MSLLPFCFEKVYNDITMERHFCINIQRLLIRGDAKLFLIKLQQEDGKSFSSIHNIRGVLRPALQMAVDDDILVKNLLQVLRSGVHSLSYGYAYFGVLRSDFERH